jgi:hypothetical protein
MNVTLGRTGWYLCDRNDNPDFEYTQFRGGDAAARHWVHQFLGDFVAMSALRRLFETTTPPRTNEQIAREVARRVASGSWLARRKVIAWVGSRNGESVAAAPLPAPPVRRPAPAPSAAPAPDAPLFPNDIDAMAIAEAQKTASRLGIPFCEECLRAAQAAARP